MFTLLSPAKINLSLKIVGKRPDGYHEIDTVMQTISLTDTITFSFAEKDLFTCTDKTLPLDETNLVVRARDLFRKKTKMDRPLSLHLEKKIPHAAGLGGGSSNAATTLFGLNSLFGFPFSLQELQDLSAELGSDVPFFFSTGSARCRGRGEKVTPTPQLLHEKVTIIKPPLELSTAAVYKNFLMKEDDAENALEAPAFFLAPTLSLLKAKLVAGGFRVVMLSGSGSAFYCLGEGVLPFLSDHKIFSCIPISRKNSWY